MVTKMFEDIDYRVEERIKEVNKERHYGEHKRGNSWKYCHDAFLEYSKRGKIQETDYEYLALHLAFYLASWGMYRGSSFLLDLDYKIHVEPVKAMMEKRYEFLFSVKNPFADDETAREYEQLLFGQEGIYHRLNQLYVAGHNAIFMQKKEENEKHLDTSEEAIKNESDTLLTKILMGVYGCIPAYDRYFKRGISLFNGQQLLNKDAVCGEKKSLRNLLREGVLKDELDAYHSAHPEYTYMKIVDMYFFSLGDAFEKKYKESERKEAAKRIKAYIKDNYQ